MKSQHRNGLTLLEVVVSLAIIFVIMALVLPAIQVTQVYGHRTQCLNNQRNVAVSLLSYASTNRGALPSRANYWIRGM